FTVRREAEETARKLAVETAARQAAQAAETRLRESEERYRRQSELLDVILQAVADGITAQDPWGKVLYANDAAARSCGYRDARALLAAPLEEVTGRFEILDEGGRALPWEQLPGRRVLKGEPHAAALLAIREKATGRAWWSELKARPV